MVGILSHKGPIGSRPDTTAGIEQEYWDIPTIFPRIQQEYDRNMRTLLVAIFPSCWHNSLFKVPNPFPLQGGIVDSESLDLLPSLAERFS